MTSLLPRLRGVSRGLSPACTRGRVALNSAFLPALLATTATAGGMAACAREPGAPRAAGPVTASLSDISGGRLLPLPANGDAKPEITANTLWAEQPQVFLITRRPGYAAKKSFDDLGVGLVCLLHENIPEEVDAYVQGFWPGAIYLDQEKDFYKAVGGGKVAKGSLLSFLNPFGRVWKNAKLSKDVKDANFKGDGLTMGGMMVVSSKGIHYQFAEETFGDRAPLEDVLAAAKLASTA